MESPQDMNIGDILDSLSSIDPNKPIKFSNGEFFNGWHCSYRGYYSDLSLGNSTDDKGHNTAYHIVSSLENALSEKVMVGYRGGGISN